MAEGKISAVNLSVRWIGAILSALWAGVHLVLTHAVLPNPNATMIYDIFFGFTASLAILAAIIMIIGLRYAYPLITAFYTIDLALLAETRLGPALFVGKRLPFNPYVYISLYLDIVLIAISILLIVIDKK
ncbi:hypothetical protein BFU36_06010 [Sulfolobus sp. A20]|uniref:hypothetical protein n=1 Tax=Sulfolobaceae TaxID=118883 RepID=UPI000845C73F|nr:MULTISPECIES: hypothetical protein [unclassified Sulfolobus]TRM74021.1 hypothetical protein DJ523_05900 [Sulfolobus sp. E5]TRM75891.1 hypothetical protein DJ532_08880 [Sulfolobus sp. A20-N-F8]TRM75986.1 hypothetical protein DJ528_08840 [Sulfolobus sp. B5]TRM81846.1 hypothetical protein DJ524_02675 [Sulfolobus sp. D5]TRM85111.1 hypothetical protein DJ522_02085 [Sulfolobus sp. F3]TRM87232.1 hypothetical protein DJ521_03985 [Sulfolobus sp. E3]TRM89737.1 hypothetical protein DJ529_00600 [Sulf